MAKIEYSCKRKKDFVTFIAIAMFLAIFVFEIYLIVFIRIQLKRENAMAHDVIKQKMLMNTEDVRKRIKKVKPSNPLQNCEVEMARTCLDSIVQYIRQNKDNMTPQQITEVNELLVRLQNSILIWGNDKFMFQQEKLEISPILRNMEQKLDNAADQGR
jgi:hypothetical protein